MRYNVSRLRWLVITSVTKLLYRDTVRRYETSYTRYTFFKYPQYVSDFDISAHSDTHFSTIYRFKCSIVIFAVRPLLVR